MKKSLTLFASLAVITILSLSGCGLGLTMATTPPTPSLFGTYKAISATCNGQLPPAGMAGWYTAPSTLTYVISSTGLSSEIWSNGSCTITLAFNTSYPSPGVFVAQTNIPFDCQGTGCTAYSTLLFGGPACGTFPPNVTAQSSTYLPASGAISGGSLSILSGASGTTCSDSGGVNPANFNLIKQ